MNKKVRNFVYLSAYATAWAAIAGAIMLCTIRRNISRQKRDLTSERDWLYYKNDETRPHSCPRHG